MNNGYFKYIEKEGEDPVEVPGKLFVIEGFEGFKKKITLGVFRSQEGFVAADFATGMRLHNGKMFIDAIQNTTKWLEQIGERAFDKIVKKYPVINTEMRSHYGEPEKKKGV